ncbi:hypothetical protein U9M48_040454 [Paspalum notatum var. saurae]|uniref:Uncharacterized protein n=1 Tax=Paspalum notatum var. saurae TaxID=547442 RepID=A0AAQ3ULT3_PASNO
MGVRAPPRVGARPPCGQQQGLAPASAAGRRGRATPVPPPDPPPLPRAAPPPAAAAGQRPPRGHPPLPRCLVLRPPGICCPPRWRPCPRLLTLSNVQDFR